MVRQADRKPISMRDRRAKSLYGFQESRFDGGDHRPESRGRFPLQESGPSGASAETAPRRQDSVGVLILKFLVMCDKSARIVIELRGNPPPDLMDLIDHGIIRFLSHGLLLEAPEA